MKILLECDHVEERAAGLHIDKKIDVAIGAIITACDRPKDAHIACAVSRREIEDFTPKATERFEGDN